MGFVWHAVKGNFDEFRWDKLFWQNSRTIARDSGKRLGEYIAQLKESGVENVVITAYSLGLMVTLKAIRYLNKINENRSRNGQDKLLIEGVFF